jgi:hypothetical protein
MRILFSLRAHSCVRRWILVGFERTCTNEGVHDSLCLPQLSHIGCVEENKSLFGLTQMLQS